MYDISSYLGKMASGLVTNEKMRQSKFGKPRKEKKRKVSYRDYHIDWKITEDDLP